MRGRGRAVVRALLVVVAGATLLRGGPAAAQDSGASELTGYQGSGAASGVRAGYNPEGLLPIAAPVDLGAPDALATVSSGPTTFARSSVADPGDLLANPSALLGLADPSLSGSVPPYPLRVSVTSALGPPSAEVTGAPGLDARVAADQSGSSAAATMPAVDAPAVLTAGTMTASASTTLANGTVAVHARATIAGVDLLGLLHVGAVVTDLTATSTDGAPRITGGTVVTGATLLGQPVTIDANGIRAAKGSSGANPLVTAVDGVLANAGITITVASPVDQAGGRSGQVVAAGLRIDLELSDRTVPAIDQLTKLVPHTNSLVPGLPNLDDVLAVAKARHLASLVVGGASVSLSTTSVAPTSSGGGDGGSPTVAEPALVAPDTGQTLTLGPTALAPASSGSRPSPAPPVQRSSVSFGVALGGAALVLLLLQPLLGSRLARWASELVDADTTTTCPREGRP